MSSMYLWKWKIEEDNESVLIVKSKKEIFSLIEQEVKLIHSYKCPCIISFEVDNRNQEYLEWINKELDSDD